MAWVPRYRYCVAVAVHHSGHKVTGLGPTGLGQGGRAFKPQGLPGLELETVGVVAPLSNHCAAILRLVLIDEATRLGCQFREGLLLTVNRLASMPI